MNIIAITKPHFYAAEIREIEHILTTYPYTLHIRKPEATAEQLEHFICSIPSIYHSRIVLHSHFHLAVKYHLKGIHHNSRNDLTPPHFSGTVSRSCHSLSEVVYYKPHYDYLFLSPIFDSISKQNYKSAFTTSELTSARHATIIDDKVYALGGVTPQRLELVEQLGFGGAAMIGAIWDNINLTPPVVLTIAGSDSSGGAGIQADIKSISALGGFATSAITAITAQNTLDVQQILPISPQLVEQQAISVFEDFNIAAIKIGMVHNAQVVEAVVRLIERYNPPFVVCDPVMVATSGAKLITDQTTEQLKLRLFPLSTLITPNLNEASAIIGWQITNIEDMRQAAKEISLSYSTSTLIKGGHLTEGSMCDILYHKGKTYLFDDPRIETRNTHGTGCTLSSAIATLLAQGYPLPVAVFLAKKFVNRAIVYAKDMQLGHGNGALWHFGEWKR